MEAAGGPWESIVEQGRGVSLLSWVAIFLAPKKTSQSFLILFVFQS